MIDTLHARVAVSQSTLDHIKRLTTARHALDVPGKDFTWEMDWNAGAKGGRPYGSYGADGGIVRFGVSEKTLVASVQVPSLPEVLVGHNARFLSPESCHAAVDLLDELLEPFGLPRLRDWEASRCDFGYDFVLEPDQLEDYLKSLGKRRPRHRGAKSDRWDRGDTTIDYKQGTMRDLTFYAKYPEMHAKHPELRDELPNLLSRGTLRFEARERRRGLNEIARGLEPRSPSLSVGRALDPQVAYDDLKRHLASLGAGYEISDVKVASRISVKHRSVQRVLALSELHHLRSRDAATAEIRDMIQSLYPISDWKKVLSELEGELLADGIVPGADRAVSLEGLKLPDYDTFLSSGLVVHELMTSWPPRVKRQGMPFLAFLASLDEPDYDLEEDS